MMNLNYETMEIEMHKGDTGTVDYQLGGDALASSDRVLWTMADKNGNPVKQEIITPVDGAFTVTFANSDTDALEAGDYPYDIRVINNPTLVNGKITDGDGVSTPMNASRVKLLKVVGNV